MENHQMQIVKSKINNWLSNLLNLNIRAIILIVVISLVLGIVGCSVGKPINTGGTTEVKKDLKDLTQKELEKEAKTNPEALVILADGYQAWGKYYDSKRGYSYNATTNYDEAYKLYLKAANANNANGQYKVGEIIWQGRGSEKDKEYRYKAFQWYKAAADQNLLEAQYMVGFIYENGIDININDFDVKAFYVLNPNTSKAKEYYQKAAEQNHIKAQYKLALLYETRVPGKDLDNYILWMFKAANSNYYLAQEALARVYFNGIYFKRDLKEALKWAQKANDNIPETDKNWHSDYLAFIKEDIYEDTRDQEAAKQGKIGIAKLAEIRQKELKDKNDIYERSLKEDERRKYELGIARAEQARELKASQAREDQDYLRRKSAAADQQKLLSNMTKKLDEGQRKINATINPNSYDAQLLAAETRQKNNSSSNNSSSASTATSSNTPSNSSSGSSSSTTSNNSSKAPSNGSSSSSSSTSNSKPKKKIVHMEATGNRDGEGYDTESLACEGATDYMKNELKIYQYQGKLLNASKCNCRDVSQEVIPKSKTAKYICVIKYDMEIQLPN